MRIARASGLGASVRQKEARHAFLVEGGCKLVRFSQMTPSWIAEKHVVFVHADGRRSVGRIAVGQPEQVASGEVRCPIALDGLERTGPIFGESSLQALLLGVRFLGMRLHDFLSKGGRVLDPEDDSDVGLDESFGTFLRDP